MFRDVRYQTGELSEIVQAMKSGNIPCVDVDDYNELEWVFNEIKKFEIYKVEGLDYDKKARDPIKEPEFEFRISFTSKPSNEKDYDSKDLMFIDFYFEPFIDEDYASCCGD